MIELKVSFLLFQLTGQAVDIFAILREPKLDNESTCPPDGVPAFLTSFSIPNSFCLSKVNFSASMVDIMGKIIALWEASGHRERQITPPPPSASPLSSVSALSLADTLLQEEREDSGVEDERKERTSMLEDSTISPKFIDSVETLFMSTWYFPACS